VNDLPTQSFRPAGVDFKRMSNLHLFELINAPAGASGTRLLWATVMAQWCIGVVPAAWALAWVRGDDDARRELLHLLMAVLLALGFAEVVSHFWPQPRPSALHLGTQYLAHCADAGLPSDHVTVFWSLALSALSTRRYAVWAFPLLAAGLAVGLARVYLGAHFPYDVLAAFPVALLGAMTARAAYSRSTALVTRALELHGQLTRLAKARMRRALRFR
jgi:undecaprenyl-diphosphatase